MKKTLKSLALATVIAIAAVCMGLFAAACDKDEEATSFTVTVLYTNGTAVNGETDALKVQLCTSDGSCFMKLPVVDANGKASFDISEVETALGGDTFLVHVIFNSQVLNLKQEATVSRSAPSVTVTLANRTAP